MADCAIRLADVCKSFRGKAAVSNLCLEVPRGSLYGFIGPNGSGKTTTLRLILRLLMADKGTVEVLSEKESRAANDGIGYLPEERGMYRKMSVVRQLAYFGRLKGMPASRIGGEIDYWLGRFDARSWKHRKIEALSKGMSQKVQFISTVISRPELLILDEPFTGLDPVNLDLIREVILELKEAGTTVLFSTHDMGAAESMCDLICMIFEGRKVLDGSLEEIQSDYGRNCVRLRLKEGSEAKLAGLPGVLSMRDLGNCQELLFEGDSQDLLRRISDLGPIERFEITRPSLHDIFVRIAGDKCDE
jgi:ABC-2 type transport system ATP-binding protein